MDLNEVDFNDFWGQLNALLPIHCEKCNLIADIQEVRKDYTNGTTKVRWVCPKCGTTIRFHSQEVKG